MGLCKVQRLTSKIQRLKGAYVIGGFFYAVRHLGLRDQRVLGPTETQMQRILQKLRNDPIMRLIVETEGVNLIPLNNVDLVPAA